MPVLLPLVSGLLLLAACLRRGLDPRQAVLATALALGALVVVITEGLGLIECLSFPWLACAWFGVACAALLLLLRSAKRAAVLFTRPRGVELGLFAGIGFIALALGFIALVAPPNSPDAMQYHMPRVLQWIQNRSVAHFPTNNGRQLSMPPGAEYALLHLQLLAGGDRFTNVVQWLCMLGALCGVSLVAHLLGATARGQLLATCFLATLPMGILQATSAKNDYAAAFWLVCFVYHGMRLSAADAPPRERVWLVLATGSALGLAALTKSTIYVFGLPFVLGFALRIFARGLRQRAAWAATLGVAGLALALNAPYLARNFALYGSALGDPSISSLFTNQISSPAALTSNVVRNVALHTGTPHTPTNAALEHGIARLHDWLGLDPSDRRTTFMQSKFRVRPPSTRENHAGNPLHVLVILAALGTGALSRRRRNRAAQALVLALLIGFVTFCFLLKWQPYHSRVHLPLFVLACAPLGLWAGRAQRAAWPANGLMALLFASSLWWVGCNANRPLFGERTIFAARMEQYFVDRLPTKERYERVAAHIKRMGCRTVGLVVPQHFFFEYPLWIMLQSEPGAVRRLDHLLAENPSAALLSSSLEPDAIVCMGATEERLARYEATYGPPIEVVNLHVFARDLR